MGAVFERGHGARVDYTPVSSVLNDNEWDVISEIAQAGEAALYWDIGDTKAITLNGTMGTLSLDTTLYVFIIGINHEHVNGITFHGFKTAETGGIDVTLIDSKNGSTDVSGRKYFNINHWGSSSSPYSTNYGGWKGCDLRYDVLGSTDTAPSGYGSTATTSRVGYDAGAATATNPVPNTLMSCLPSDLRAVMRPMTIYTDNTGNSSAVEANVTASIDYLPLMAEYEVFGTRKYANTYEQNRQTQYAYYADGNNSKTKYKHNSTSSGAGWWLRSARSDSNYRFLRLGSSGNQTYGSPHYSYAISPMFLV